MVVTCQLKQVKHYEFYISVLNNDLGIQAGNQNDILLIYVSISHISLYGKTTMYRMKIPFIISHFFNI